MINVQSNAFDPLSGHSLDGEISPDADDVKVLALSRHFQGSLTTLAPQLPVSLADPFHPDVGWGLIVEEGLDPIPAPLKKLLAARKANVYYYRPGWEHAFTLLRDTKHAKDLSIASSPRGTDAGCLPFYLMIYGTPDRIPWDLQFVLGGNRCVGRLPLEGDHLANYVDALLDDFKASPSDAYSSVTWAVDLGSADITHLLRNQIASRVDAAIATDKEMTRTFVDGACPNESATANKLLLALAKYRPGLILTTSHGMTGPSNDAEQMRRMLGVPVDQDGAPLEAEELLNEWNPGGAVWYCHACCSAGSTTPSSFANLFSETSELRRVLKSVEALGPTVAQFPQKLLGAKSPLRAFVGHVEPTFDWTIRSPLNKQSLTGALVAAIYPNLFQTTPRTPVGLAFRDWSATQAPLFIAWDRAQLHYDGSPAVVEDLLRYQLAMRDIQSTVILGDPAAMIALRPASVQQKLTYSAIDAASRH
jgi:hypothetical protein